VHVLQAAQCVVIERFRRETGAQGQVFPLDSSAGIHETLNVKWHIEFYVAGVNPDEMVAGSQ
jgi:hypothetical protein